MKELRKVLIFVCVITLFLTILVGCSRQRGSTAPTDRTVAGDKEDKSPAEGKEDKKDKGDVDISVSGTTVRVKGDGDEGTVKIEGPEGTVKITGDGDKGTVKIEGPEGTVKITGDEDKGEIRVEGKDGVVTSKTTKKIKESDFNIKFYSGAKVIEGTRSTVAAPGGKKIEVQHVILESSDDIDKIKKFYVKQIANPTVVENEGEITIASTMPVDGKTTVVQIEKGDEEGKVKIEIVIHDMNK